MSQRVGSGVDSVSWGVSCLMLGQFEDAEVDFENVLRIGEAARDGRIQCDGLGQLGWLGARRDDPNIRCSDVTPRNTTNRPGAAQDEEFDTCERRDPCWASTMHRLAEGRL